MEIKDNTVQTAINELLGRNITNQTDLMRYKRRIARQYGIRIPDNSRIIKELNLMAKAGKLNAAKAERVKRLLRKRAVRTLSGVAPVAVLTKPHSCPGHCAYCPTEPGVPQSYLSNEPAVMRAIRCRYDPFVQVQDRLRALTNNGHEPDKIELIVIGGTWSVLPRKYKYWYITECFRAANEFKINKSKGPVRNNLTKLSVYSIKKDLLKQQKINERSRFRLIGITLETRPDHIDEKELWEMRELGATRIELGVQAIDDKILDKNKRGHGVYEIAAATGLLKDFGFKVTYHIMPGLPGATAGKDLKMFRQLFTDERFQPDQIKFYPTVVTKGSLLYRWWRQGKYKPYSEKVLRNLIIECKAAVPRYVRIIRLIRDIPAESIVAGNRITNLRQELKLQGVKCNCIRCREPRGESLETGDWRLEIVEYNASSGKEYFISANSRDKKILYGFCRLRIENRKSKIENSLVRELHVYGELVPVGKGKKIQHAGLGRRLMAEAERIAREQGCEKIAVIAGVGVRPYYRKLGYRLRETYMVKKLVK